MWRSPASAETVRAPVEIRPGTPEDLPPVLALNNQAPPAVNALSAERLRWLVGKAREFLVAEAGGRLAGFLLVLPPEAEYDSPNFRWFRSRYTGFLYIDRIVVAPGMRGRGIGAALYRELLARAGPAVTRLTCEVNLRPVNQGSLSFHAALGFREVGRQDTDGGAKTVSLQVREVPTRAGPASADAGPAPVSPRF
jgi:predicted GNAT superfamily acetyltransferase